MRKAINLLLILSFGLLSCESDKKYSDYNEDDFYEVQGIIKFANPTSYPFDHSIVKDISFTYFLDRPNPITGIEKKLEMREAQKDYPVIVLVHKDDENISFYGRVGILENLNEKEKEVLSNHIQNQMDKVKAKTPAYIYDALIKDSIKESK
ncbi:hypothetical protein [uncultured Algibacter sp.]|uniref:hypothetical protein n=1 Tax=uncultured Algibacter sp. TaxID=298659 RepID=UPI00261B17E7|nr:hypothetical protein [uncultured Algibacter sp.]